MKKLGILLLSLLVSMAVFAKTKEDTSLAIRGFEGIDTMPITEQAVLEYYHIFPTDPGPVAEEKACTGLDALSPDCLGIDVETGS